MKIRLLQKKNKTFWIQQSRRIFGKTYWITLRDRKKFFKNFAYYITANLAFPFLIYGIWYIFSSDVNFLEDSLELLLSSYIYWACIWSVMYSLGGARVSEIFYFDKYFTSTEVRYNKKVININNEDLVKSGKRTIFGKVKDVYYMSKKDLRKQKLEKLNSIFK